MAFKVFLGGGGQEAQENLYYNSVIHHYKRSEILRMHETLKSKYEPAKTPLPVIKPFKLIALPVIV